MKEHNLFLYALDPTHIGAGGYRLGRVDNTVMRDAATGLPKLPGSSISGACRAAAIYSLPDEQRELAHKYARATLDSQNKKRPHKGEEDPVAQIFGYAEGDEAGASQIGMIGFRDAHIFAFPVSTMNGPRWITTAQRLRDAGVENPPEPKTETQILVHQKSTTADRLNLGWLLLETEKADFIVPKILADNKSIEKQLVIVAENLFPSIVNANLEVRTSVAIDFETGAGAQGALFTYEAVPRGTIYQTAVNFDNDRFPARYDYAQNLLKKSMTLACGLGFGGMTTRGFGRMEALWEDA
ncbi:MAG: type III-B CRISPR module RAMP protein Cmr4 [Methylococcaceae bacterium]